MTHNTYSVLFFVDVVIKPSFQYFFNETVKYLLLGFLGAIN